MSANSPLTLSTRTAREIAKLISSGELSCREVVDTCIERIVSSHERINAVVVPLFDEARAEADRHDITVRSRQPLGPLHGVPFTVKESFDVRGAPTTLGLPSRKGHYAERDSPLVACLREAGAILLGKTNVPQLVVGNECANPLYGRTSNPWNRNRTSGGTSGGEAAVLAVGGSVLGLGSDIGGSIRLPASACGVHGFKPTSGRFTMEGHGNVLGGQAVIVAQPGPLARSVDDLSLALNALAQAVKAQGWESAGARASRRDPQAVALEQLRFAVYDDDGILRPSPAIRRAVDEAASALQNVGVTVERWHPPNLPAMWQTYCELLFADGMAHLKRAAGRDLKSDQVKQLVSLAAIPSWLFPVMRKGCQLTGQRIAGYSLAAMGSQSVDRYWQVLERRDQLCGKFLQEMDEKRFDGILCPPDALPALPHGASQSVGVGLSYCALYNLLGMPAGVVAATRVRSGEETDRAPTRDRVETSAKKTEAGSTGLPVGVQVVARHWREDVALAVMGCLEIFFRTKEDYPLRALQKTD